MFYPEKKDLVLKHEEILSEVESQYYSFLGDQQEMRVNMAPYVAPKTSGLSGGLGIIKVPNESDDKAHDAQSRTALPTSSEHFMPYLMRYIFERRMGVLPYQSQLNERKAVGENGEVEYKEIRRYNVRERIKQIDDHKIMLA